jgi:prepilin-type N-terminal cleavage/methylation domain-containing protein
MNYRAARAFTLLELMVVMILVGVVAGIGMAGFDRIEPGRSSLRAAVENFLESSRDRARASRQPVIAFMAPPTEELSARWQRLVYRLVLEATFEAAAEVREGVILQGQSELGAAGRFGACLDLSEGGAASLEGRGTPDLSRGYVVDFDCYSKDQQSGQLFNWPGVLRLRQRSNGQLECSVRAGDGDFFGDILLESPVGVLQPNRWHHVRVVASDGEARLLIDGEEVALEALPDFLSSPQDVPVFGSLDQPWEGKIDEWAVQVRKVESGPEIPDDVQVVLSSSNINFNRFGSLDDFHLDDVLVELESFGESIGGFVVGRFSQEAIDVE